MSKIIPLPHQKEIIASESPITIVNWKRAEGASTGMILKWLCSMQSALMLDSYDSGYNFQNCRKILSQAGIDFTVTDNMFGRQVTIKGTSQSILFCNPEEFFDQAWINGANHSLLLVDNVDLCFNYPKSVSDIVERRKPKQQIIFSCDYGNLGWRHLEYNRGEAVVDEKGNLVGREYSWDRCLIDWQHNDLKRYSATKAGVEFYKDGVRVL